MLWHGVWLVGFDYIIGKGQTMTKKVYIEEGLFEGTEWELMCEDELDDWLYGEGSQADDEWTEWLKGEHDRILEN